MNLNLHNRVIDCENENFANFLFKKNVLKLGKANLSSKQTDHIAFLLASDIKNFAEQGGDFSKLTANEIYSHLQNNQ